MPPQSKNVTSLNASKEVTDCQTNGNVANTATSLQNVSFVKPEIAIRESYKLSAEHYELNEYNAKR